VRRNSGRAPCLPAEQSRVDELERALRLLRSGADLAGIAEALSRRLTNKLLHAPTKAIQR
jgi:glutamyl-tRNA reductase